MKYILIFLFSPIFGISQHLNDINTVEQAEQYVIKNLRYYGTKYDGFAILQSNESDFDTFNFGDFNYDGYKDLLIFGTAEVHKGKENYTENEVIILIGGKRRAKKVRFPDGYFRYKLSYAVPYPKIITIDGKDYIQVKHNFYNRMEKEFETFIDTVFIKYDHVIPFEKTPDDYKISRIDFKSDYCYGSCPVFELSIDQSGEVSYYGIDHVSKKGNHDLRIKKDDWNYLVSLLNHIKIKELKDNYSVNWTDDQTGYLEILFESGERKQIKDYGMAGTFGLSILFDYLIELREF